MRTYSGRCHCGAVVFEFESELITKGLRCNCSFCRRTGAIVSMKIARDWLRIVSGSEILQEYRFCDEVVHHQFCSNCGVYVFYTGDGPVRVNLGCVDEIDLTDLPIELYDGANLL